MQQRMNPHIWFLRFALRYQWYNENWVIHLRWSIQRQKKQKKLVFHLKKLLFHQKQLWHEHYTCTIVLFYQFVHRFSIDLLDNLFERGTNDRNEIKLDERAKELFCDCCCCWKYSPAICEERLEWSSISSFSLDFNSIEFVVLF